jgi:hypothetical protein
MRGGGREGGEKGKNRGKRGKGEQGRMKGPNTTNKQLNTLINIRINKVIYHNSIYIPPFG